MNVRAGFRIALPAASATVFAAYLAGGVSAPCMIGVIAAAGGLFASLRLNRVV